MAKRVAETIRVTPETAMAGGCFAGPDPEEIRELLIKMGHSSFEEQKRLFSNKPLRRQIVKRREVKKDKE